MLVRNKEKYKAVVAKYAGRIAGIAKANNVDLGVAEDMLFANFRIGTKYPGGGELTGTEYAELKADIDGMYEEKEQQVILMAKKKGCGGKKKQVLYTF